MEINPGKSQINKIIGEDRPESYPESSISGSVWSILGGGKSSERVVEISITFHDGFVLLPDEGAFQLP